MKKEMYVQIVAVAVAFVTLNVSAAEDCILSGMAEKGSHGLVNIFTGWFELPMQVYKGYQHGVDAIEAPAASRSLGMLGGVFRGVSHAVGRTGWGVIQLGGFWTSNPTTNEHLMQLLDAEYAWEMGTRQNMFSDFDANLNRVGMRFERGARNLVGSLTEIPGQIRKADAEQRVYVGIPKGLWFASSRLIYGAADMVFIIIPSPAETYGVPFDEVEGWHALQGDYYTNIPLP